MKFHDNAFRFLNSIIPCEKNKEKTKVRIADVMSLPQ